jgi:hypothetical protein
MKLIHTVKPIGRGGFVASATPGPKPEDTART